MHRRIFTYTFAALGIMLAAYIGMSVLNINEATSEKTNTPEIDVKFGSIDADPEATQTPPPFYEMTIPYVRSRTYESSLAELDQYSKGSNYTSYLTSYDSDGYRVDGLLTIPSGDEPTSGWPAIVFIHGYIPPTIYETTDNYQSYVDYFARNGFVVFKIDLRGHDESEGEANGAYYSSDYIVDALNARAALQSADFVNPSSVGLWGHSMAGNVVFRSVIAAQDIPAAVIWAGAVYTYEDWQEYRLNDNSYRPPTDMSERRRRRQELFDTHGEFEPTSSFWKEVVPTNFVDGITTPIEIHHAVNDSVVNVEYSRNLEAVLQNSSIPLTVYEYQSGGHNISGGSFNIAMQRSVDFFKTHLSQ